MARKVVERHFGSKPRRLVRQGGGLTNDVFLAEHDAGSFIVRLAPDPAKVREFAKEQWAISRAAQAGVPTPEVLEVGNAFVPAAYMIARRARGEEATHHPRRHDILRELGRLASLVHTVRTSGFGGNFDWCREEQPRNATWQEFLENELRLDERIEVLEKHGFLTAAQCGALRRSLEDLGTLRESPALNHGDLRLKNVLADEAGRITAVVDWELATSSFVPYWDLSLALHDLSIDAMQCLLDGYGLAPREVRDMAPYLKALNVINYVPYIERALETGDEAQLDRYRTRLSGALDLYSL
jgi:hygromycin-B 4-O-kinase